MLKAGDRLGPYEVIGVIGAGGMGEVFRARDTRLQREVAIKVLRGDAANDPGRLHRFEIEARAVSALNHPNLLVLFDVGVHEGSPFVVTELLEGETLRQRLHGGPLPTREAIEIATQVAHGLAAAHEKGIVHRDLKPENLYLLANRRVKILDFGLAKLTAPNDDALTKTAPPVTEAGQTLGTVGYMAPEQVTGEGIGPAADLFALGAVLYEMISGKRAFDGATRVDILHAILRADPPELPPAPVVPAALDRMIRRCLAKRPDDRFRSAHDLAFALETLAGAPSSGSIAVTEGPTRRRWAWPAAAALVIVSAIAAWVGLSRLAAPAVVQPRFMQVTSRRQGVGFARFAPDGQTIVYNATQQEGAHELFSARVGSADARAYNIRASILAISKSGELALKIGNDTGGPGTLARMPLEGGSPREVLTDVAGAAWSAAGDLAVIHVVGGLYRLEYPIGTVRAQAARIMSPYFSPDNTLLAFYGPIDGQPTLQIVDLTRTDGPRPIFQFRFAPIGLCWQSKDFLYLEPGDNVSELRAVDLLGHDRWLLTLPGNYVLQDCRPDGAVIVERMNTSGEIAVQLTGAADVVDLSWLNNNEVADVSGDGHVMLFEGGTAPFVATYIRRLDPISIPVRLGDGFPAALSPDGKWALASSRGEQLLLPTGAGQPRHLPSKSLAFTGRGSWLPDGTHIVFVGAEPGRPPRCFVQGIDDEAPQPVTPENTGSCSTPAPDGRRIFVSNTTVFDLATKASHPLAGLSDKDTPLRWNADGSAVYVATAPSAAVNRIYRVDVPSGRRTLLREVRAVGPIGGNSGGISAVRVSADAQTIAYTVNRYFSELTVIEWPK